MKIAIVGRGKVGRAFHAALGTNSFQTQLVKARPTPRHLPQADVYLLAVPDARIRSLCEELAPLLPARCVVLHCAGARDAQELAAARAKGASVAALHPLVSFADPRKPPNLRGVTFVAQGDKAALTAARRLARAVGARCVTRPVLGPAYHAAAALVANGGAALTHAGVQILLALGLNRREATRGLASLLRSVADNVDHMGLPGALTGPVVRGDAATVIAHLQALEHLDPRARAAYAAVQPLVVACAKEAGLDLPAVRRIERALRSSSRRAQRKT